MKRLKALSCIEKQIQKSGLYFKARSSKSVNSRSLFVLDPWVFVLDHRAFVSDYLVFVLDHRVFGLRFWVFVSDTSNSDFVLQYQVVLYE